MEMLSPAQRTRPCETCGTPFTPRMTQLRAGHGRYCSQKCNKASHKAITSPEVLARGKATMAKLRADGKINYRTGEDNPVWKGGYAATKRRWIESGKANALLRKYRKENPDKIREFTIRRAGRKIGKLPYGTIPAIRQAQGNICAICGVCIAKKSHVDHIMPLALGGRHEPGNIQLLCPPCNLRKSNKHPDAFCKASPKAREIREARDA